MNELGGGSIISSDDDDFEGGDNKIEKKVDVDIENEFEFMNLVKNDVADDVEAVFSRETMSLQSKTNYFVNLQLIIVL